MCMQARIREYVHVSTDSDYIHISIFQESGNGVAARMHAARAQAQRLSLSERAYLVNSVTVAVVETVSARAHARAPPCAPSAGQAAADGGQRRLSLS